MNAEKELMEHHGIYLIGKEVLAEDKVLTECYRLKRYSLLPDVRQPLSNKFGLIRQDALLPNAVERAIDFRLNSNRHRCICNCSREVSACIPHIRTVQDTPKTEVKETHHERIFEATPRHIVFHNYKLNVTYRKTLKIRNITKITRAIALKVLPKTKYFVITLNSTNRVAPGICVVYNIQYRTDIYRDVKETIRFTTYTGHDVVVKLRSCSYSPSLRVYVFKSGILSPEKTNHNALTQSDFNIERTMALNSSIDCGHTLIGQEVKLSLIMKNEGGYGKFFFLKEADWYHYSIFNINKNMELIAGTFQLYPVYFEVDENEFIEVMVSFLPKRYGLFVETIYLICSNNTCDELDLMGDGVYFEKSFITFDLKQKDCHPFFLDYESEYCVHLGKTLSCQLISAFLYVQNKSPLNLEYRWAVRKSENSMTPDFKHLSSNWVQIDQEIRFLPRYSTNQFLVSVKPETTVEGLYRMVLCLFIENIPEESLHDHENFAVVERKDSTPNCKLLDVLVGEVEILVDVEAIRVLIEPNPLIIPYHPHTSVKHSQEIKLIPQTPYTIQCQWKHHKTNTGATIEPKVFELCTKGVNCTVTVDTKEVGNIEEHFLLWVNGGVFREYFHVILATQVPRVVFNPAALYFDDVMNEFLYEQTVYIENPSGKDVSWHIIEEVLDPKRGTITVENDETRIIPNNGMLKPDAKCAIRYIANTTVIGENLSFLKIFTNFTDTDKFDSICSVRYNVCKPELLVHTNTSELPILCPEEMLFVGNTTELHVCIHNTGNIVAIFLWGEPTGPSAQDFHINLSPRLGIIRRQESVHVDVTIKPKSMGYFEDVYIPLFALGIDKVTLVKLMCLVGDITVNIYLPDNNDEFEQILWPKMICDEYEETYAPEFNPIIIGAPGEDDSSLEYAFEGTTKDFTYETLTTYEEPTTNLYSALGEDSILTDLNPFQQQSLQSDFVDSKKISSSERSSMVDTSTTVPGRSIKAIILDLFRDKVVFQKYSMEFQRVPLRTPVKKSVKIENLSPGEGRVYVETVNFYPEVERKNVINDVLAKLKMAKSTEWDDIVTPEGIVVKIDEPMRQLHPFEIIEFNVWVYATTWGYYVDELVIDISQMLPFCASILIEVVGHPIEYPFAQNSIRPEPIVRMGILSYKSENVQRRVKIVNTSVCTVYITWQIFINSGDKSTKSFSVLLDMPLSDHQCRECNSKPQFIVTNEYYGEVNSIYFEIEPTLSKILPGRYAYVDVTINVNNFDELSLNQSSFAYLVGIVKVPCECRIQPNLYVRPHGIDIGCTKVKITYEIDLPILVIDDLPDKIRLSTYASDIMENDLFHTRKRLLLKNTRQTDALVALDIEKPFKIVNITTPHGKLKDLKGSAILNPEETMEIVIECVLSRQDILDVVEDLKIGTKQTAMSIIDFEENSLRISKYLSIYQREFLQNMIPLQLKVFFPIFRANPIHIQFGNVYIGNTAKKIVSIQNMTAFPLKFQVYKMNKYPEVIITPDKGIIPKFMNAEECVLSVFFTPTEPQTYLLWFAVETALPHHFVVINVVGVGTYDEHFYRPGLH